MWAASVDENDVRCVMDPICVAGLVAAESDCGDISDSLPDYSHCSPYAAPRDGNQDQGYTCAKVIQDIPVASVAAC